VTRTSVTWRGLTLTTGTDAAYRILSLEGWEERPTARYDKQVRTRGHGTHPSPLWSDERIVTIEGQCWSEEQRDQMLFGLQAAAAYGEDDSTEPLTVVAANRTLSAGAQLLVCKPMLARTEWGMGRFGWLLQWRCPDPLRYGPARSPYIGLPVSGGGLTYPLTYPLDYGAPGSTGQLVLTNAGTAPAPIVFGVRGALPQGFELSAGSRRLTYVAQVPSGQVIAVDTAAGTVLVEGTADRRANLTYADWLEVPPMSSLTVQFTSLGGVYDVGAQLTATFADTYW